jgi:hypothetical protein
LSGIRVYTSCCCEGRSSGGLHGGYYSLRSGPLGAQ